jgi:hypothetical protein
MPLQYCAQRHIELSNDNDNDNNDDGVDDDDDDDDDIRVPAGDRIF